MEFSFDLAKVNDWRKNQQKRIQKFPVPEIKNAESLSKRGAGKRSLGLVNVYGGFGVPILLIVFGLPLVLSMVQEPTLQIGLTILALGLSGAFIRLGFQGLKHTVGTVSTGERFWNLGKRLSAQENSSPQTVIRFFAEAMTHPYEKRMESLANDALEYWNRQKRISNIPSDLQETFKDLLLVEMWLDAILNSDSQFSGIGEQGAKGYARAIRQLADDTSGLREFGALVASMGVDPKNPHPIVKQLVKLLLPNAKSVALTVLPKLPSETSEIHKNIASYVDAADELWRPLDSGEYVDLRDAGGNTFLHHLMAARPKCRNENHWKAIELLLDYGANPMVENNDGRTPLDIAKSEKNEIGIQILNEVLSDTEQDFHASIQGELIKIESASDLKKLIDVPTSVFVIFEEEHGVANHWVEMNGYLLPVLRRRLSKYRAKLAWGNPDDKKNGLKAYLREENLPKQGLVWYQDGKIIEYEKKRFLGDMANMVNQKLSVMVGQRMEEKSQ